MTQEKDLGTPNPPKEKPQEQEKSEIKTKTIPQNLWSAAAQKSPWGELVARLDPAKWMTEVRKWSQKVKSKERKSIKSNALVLHGC